MSRFLVFLIFVVVMVFCVAPGVSALTIGPPLVEIKADPGEGLIQKIRIYNESTITQTFYSSLENFTPNKKTGLPIFAGDVNPLGAAHWIKVPVKSLTLKAGEAKDVLLNIKVPDMMTPGGYYVALFWSDQAPGKSGINVANRLATLFLFRINGTIKEELKIVNFQNQIKDSNVDFNLRVENSGNAHLQPIGELQITDWRGKKVESFPINKIRQNILPLSQRGFNFSWSAPGWGKYYAQAQLKYGENNAEAESEKIGFWVAPKIGMREITGLIILIGLVITGFVVAKKKFYNF